MPTAVVAMPFLLVFRIESPALAGKNICYDSILLKDVLIDRWRFVKKREEENNRKMSQAVGLYSQLVPKPIR